MRNSVMDSLNGQGKVGTMNSPPTLLSMRMNKCVGMTPHVWIKMGVPAKLIADRGSEFISMDTRALVEGQLDVKMVFIPAGEHQQNLVICAIRVTQDQVTWRAAISESTYQYNCTLHSSTGFAPNLLHHGYETTSPGLLHPEGVPANPPPVTHPDRVKQNLKKWGKGNLIGPKFYPPNLA